MRFLSALTVLVVTSGIASCSAEQLPERAAFLQVPGSLQGFDERKCASLAHSRSGERYSIVASSVEIRNTKEVCVIEGLAPRNARFILEVPEDWNGDLLFQGCGGFCGAIYIDRARDALSRGYAIVATDMGHEGSPLDASWAKASREAEIDFAYRATHNVAIAAKNILSFLDRPPTWSVFRGCSTGGRQGLMSAQRYPQDFDMIIAGAPVINYINGSGIQLLWSAELPVAAGSGYSLTEDDVRVLADAVLHKCDGLDGDIDGVLDDPRQCQIDWSSPICNQDNCLSATAAKTARAIYDGPAKLEPALLRGPEYGSEPNWIGTYVEGAQAEASYRPFMASLFRYLAFSEDMPEDWSPSLAKIREYAERGAANHALLSANDPDLDRYLERGGKILIYHGWRDQSVVPQSTLDYLASLETRYGSIPDGVRAFMVPGLDHCRGGVGATEVDWLSVAEAWRNGGSPPEKVEATDPLGSVRGIVKAQ